MKAGAIERILFAHIPHCVEADQVRLNGETVGTLDQLKGAQFDPQFLLDTSGSHCYRFEWQTYSSWGSGGMPDHGKQMLRAQKFRFMESHVDDFLEPLPGSVMSSVSVATQVC